MRPSRWRSSCARCRAAAVCERSAAARHRRLGLPGRRGRPPGGGRRLGRGRDEPSHARAGAARRARPGRRGGARRGACGPDCVIHTAYLQDGPDAWATNVDGSAHVATAAAAAGARLIHLSTDLVFDGRAGRPYREDDPAEPVHRVRPLEGRGRAGGAGGASGGDGRADVADLRRRGALGPRAAHPGRRRRPRPTWPSSPTSCAARCASATWRRPLLALAADAGAGPLHLAGADGVSRYEFACLVAAANGRPSAHLRTTTSAEVAPQRPRDCRLDCSRAARLLGGRLRGVRAVLGP